MEDKTIRALLMDKKLEDTNIDFDTSNNVQISRAEPKPIVEPKPDVQASSPQPQKINIAELRQKAAPRTKVVEGKEINFFGGHFETDEPEPELQPKAQETSSVILTPNYDFIEPLSEQQEKKIFKIKKEPKPKRQTSPLLQKLKIIVFTLMIAVFGSWTIYNAVELSQVVTEYNLKLDQYLLKLATLDSVSGMNDLFPTYPEDANGAASIAPKSNWFDRVCNFISGIFGG